MGAVVAVVGIGLFSLWIFARWDESAPEAPDVPLQVATSLQGVQLGDKLAAVISSHGPFDKEVSRPGLAKKYADEEDYLQRNGSLRLGVRNGVIFSVGYPCKEGRDRTALNNVACHALQDRIRNVFGDRLRVLCAKVKAEDPNKDVAALARAYDAIEYGTRYIVIKDVVEGFIVMDVKELESLVGFNWEKCR